MTNIGRSERNIAHRLIEEFMLAANRAVAHYLIQRGLPALHRVHEKPDARKVLEFEELARAFGYSLASKISTSAKSPSATAKFPHPQKAGRPDSRGQSRERQMRAVLPPPTSASPRNTISASSRNSPANPKSAFFLT